MMFSTNRLVGATVYRTRKALNADPAFMQALADYKYRPNCLYDDTFHMWHYPGTHMEIAEVITKLGKTIQGGRVKFPCIMNFLPVTQQVSGDTTQIRLNLAICTVTDHEWLTPMRELKVFDTVLRPIYREFIKQISRSPYLQNGYGEPQHTMTELFTTGQNAGQVSARYGGHLDAIEVANLLLTLNPRLCERDIQQMAEENKKVITEFN